MYYYHAFFIAELYHSLLIYSIVERSQSFLDFSQSKYGKIHTQIFYANVAFILLDKWNKNKEVFGLYGSFMFIRNYQGVVHSSILIFSSELQGCFWNLLVLMMSYMNFV